VEGLFDQLFLLEGPDVEVLKPVAEVLARYAVWPPPPKDPKTPDFALARYVVWPAQAGTQRPEIGLGHDAVWPPVKPLLPPVDAAVAVASGPSTVSWPAPPQFLMLSSAEQRKILTQSASHRDPPKGQGWTPLLPLPVVIGARERINWMRTPPGAAAPAPAEAPPAPGMPKQ